MSENVLYVSVELKLKIISSSGCTIFFSGYHEFPLVQNACKEKH